MTELREVFDRELFNKTYGNSIILTGERELINFKEPCIIGNYCIDHDRESEIKLQCGHYYCLKDFVNWFKIADGGHEAKCLYCQIPFDTAQAFYFGKTERLVKELEEIRKKEELKKKETDEKSSAGSAGPANPVPVEHNDSEMIDKTAIKKEEDEDDEEEEDEDNEDEEDEDEEEENEEEED